MSDTQTFEGIGQRELAYQKHLVRNITGVLESKLGRVETTTLALLDEVMALFQSNGSDGTIDELIEAFKDGIRPFSAKEDGFPTAAEESDSDSDLLHETPVLTDSFNLAMFDSGGDCIQDISMSRAEYIALKKHLAALREAEPHAEEKS